MCHFQVSSHCWCVSIFCHRVLADYGPPIAAARPVICHGPPVSPPHAAASPAVSHGSLYGLPLLLPPSPHFCHVPLSGLLTLLVCSILSKGGCMASPCCCPHPPTVGPLWFCP
ncbi:unnamed protein product [Staurois parvus]|uniref:Uncharacterized protein n=1 Tax=Staurois parvus TaxID=386267 RepID=A0ABN9GXG3_9NEOB|nr:unnamed protein product [Staurois parvus]